MSLERSFCVLACDLSKILTSNTRVSTLAICWRSAQGILTISESYPDPQYSPISPQLLGPSLSQGIGLLLLCEVVARPYHEAYEFDFQANVTSKASDKVYVAVPS